MSEWNFNRGEWAEGYVFLKALGGGRIHAGTADLKTVKDTYIDIKNIQKRLGKNTYTFERTQVGSISCMVNCYKNGEKYNCISSDLFFDKSIELYKAISNSGPGNITIPNIQHFFESLDIDSIKSPPMTKKEVYQYGGKTDIFLKIKNSIDNMEENIGFSIKSHFGSSPTLLNCGAGTNYLFEIHNCTDEDMVRLNALNSIEDILNEIKHSNYLRISSLGSAVIKCRGESNISGPVFDMNLEHVDSNFPNIIPVMLLSLYGYYEKPISRNIPDVVSAIAKVNPLRLRSSNNPYETMFKNLLFAAFSGLTATKPWDGRKSLTGGYIDVAENGDILYFRALSDDQFLTYLYNSTCIDNPAKGARHKAVRNAAMNGINLRSIDSIKGDHGDYGYVFEYNDDGDIRKVLGINFQIRFRR